jgi:hypothetical protein
VTGVDRGRRPDGDAVDRVPDRDPLRLTTAIAARPRSDDVLGRVMILAANLIVDLVYAWIDPRVRLA